MALLTRKLHPFVIQPLTIIAREIPHGTNETNKKDYLYILPHDFAKTKCYSEDS